jgi:ferric-dicitrate binding protein FerR (iron transport regulator)
MRKILLTDGSTIALNTHTTLRYPVNFGKSKRRIELLKGEAIFEVAHDSTRPFIVSSRDIRTRVLGTRFSVTALDGLETVKVRVERGKVKVNHTYHKLGILTKGQSLCYNRTTHKLVKEVSYSYFNYENNLVFLDNCSFEEFALRIERIYGVRLLPATSKVEDYRFTGEIFLNEDLELTMFKFCTIHGGGYTIYGKEVVME